VTTVVPVGFLGDKGKVYSVRTNGKTYGRTVAQTGRQQLRNYQIAAELDTSARLKPLAGDTAGVWELALPNGTYPVIVVCGDPLSTLQTNHMTIEGTAVTDPDPSASAGYTQGDFDGYAVTVTVSDGKLTITTGTGAADPKLCFVEVGPMGSTIDAATTDRLADLVMKATDATHQAALPLVVTRTYVFGAYIDELLSYTVGSSRYFVHSNHLYSPSAVTNTAGQVQERYRYDAYGKQTITNATGTVRNQSAVGFSRGFTGYILDAETGLYYARARMYSAGLGRFIERDPLQYIDGMGMYGAYFVPGDVDPLGLITIEGVRKAIAEARRRGHGHAADNLQHWLDGSGSTYEIDVDWLRKSPVTQAAEAKNEMRLLTHKKMCSKKQSIYVLISPRLSMTSMTIGMLRLTIRVSE